MKKISRRSFMKLVGAGAAAGALAACGGGSDSASTAGSAAAGSGSTGGTPTITFYPSAANVSSGAVGGYKGEFFASRGFNLEVWAYSDERTNAILASGDLPDVMFVPEDSLDIMIQGGMLVNLDEHMDKLPHLQSFGPGATALNYMRAYKSAGTGGVYALPNSIGDNYNKFMALDTTERNAVKLRWDVYEKIGAPAINSMDDLLDVMEQMMAAQPTEEDGTPNFGTILNSGSDTSYWACMVMWYRMQGYKEDQLGYLLEMDMVNGTISSILSKDSMYYKGLKWYNEAYRRGLIDPDSISNDRATQKVKVDGGYAMVPSGYLPGWAPKYMPYYIPGTKIYYNASRPYGNVAQSIGISSKTQNLDACLAFLDILCDPDAYLLIASGPDGEFWYSDENGDAYLTDAAMDYLNAGGSYTVLDEFQMSTGENLKFWNTPWVAWNGSLSSYGDGQGEKRCCYTAAWNEINELSTDTDIYRQWQQTVGHESWMEWLESENAFYDISDIDYISAFTSLPDDMMQLTIDAIRDKVVNASWRMVYANDQATFDAEWDQMIADCEGLDAQSIIDWRLADIENAIKVRDSLQA